MYQPGAGPGPNPQQGGPGQRQWDPSQQGPQGQTPPATSQHQQPYRPDPNLHRIPPGNASYQPGQEPHAQNPSLRPDRPEMAAVHHHPSYYPPQHPGAYLPSPSAIYPPPPPHTEQYRPPPAQPQSNAQQSAPRQRTAIACKYCRRRKIRCSGFENSEDGRCSNCVRFSQECVFTPVSSQAQAFVPAQALYGRGQRAAGPPQRGQLYGPYGNPLPNPHEQYAQPPNPYGPHSPAGHYPYPPPPNMHQPYGYPPPPHPQHAYDPNAPVPNVPNLPNGRQRGREDANTPTLPPPNNGMNSHMHNQRPEEGAQAYAYPDPSTYAPNPSNHSPSSNPGYGQNPPPYYSQQPPPQHPQQGPRRGSPGSTSAYSYEPGRDSNSPHSAPGYPGYPAQQPMQSLPGGPQGSRTPPSGNGDRGRNGMSIHDMVQNEGSSMNGNNGERNAADSNMVSALNRPPPRR